MPKLKADYPVTCNLLLPDDGTKEVLVAISFYRGERGSFAGPARDFLRDGCDRFQASLTGRERARFLEILETVRAAAGVQKAVDSDTRR